MKTNLNTSRNNLVKQMHLFVDDCFNKAMETFEELLKEGNVDTENKEVKYMLSEFLEFNKTRTRVVYNLKSFSEAMADEYWDFYRDVVGGEYADLYEKLCTKVLNKDVDFKFKHRVQNKVWSSLVS